MEFGARISGTGAAFPQRRVSNVELAADLAGLNVDTNDRWIRERTGIVERRYSDLGGDRVETNSALGAAAAQQALEMAGKSADDVDQILYATCTPDTLIPSTGCWLQDKIGAKRAWVMDINAACSGFLYGVHTAEQFVCTGKSKTVLVVGAEVLSPFLNWRDRTSCILFGDGAGAAVVERVPNRSSHRILAGCMLSNGHLNSLFQIPAGGSNMEVTPERYRRGLNKIRMNGKEIFRVAVRTMSECALRSLEQIRLPIGELDWVVPHQANLRIIEAVANRLHVPMDQVLVNIDRFGNTSAATIPSVLDEGIRAGRIQGGQTVLMVAFGAGLTAGAVLFRW